MKKKLLSILLFIFLFISLNAEIIEKKYYFNNYEIIELDGYQIINFENTLLTGKAGEPTLPYKDVSLLLPPGEIAESIEIIGYEETELVGFFELYPQQHSQPISEGRSGEFVKDLEVYNSDVQYPEKLYGELSTHFMNGYSFGFSAFTPIKYFPSTGKISFFKKVTVKISTRIDEKSYQALENLNSSPRTIKKVRRIAQNPKFISCYPEREPREGDYQMLIVTPSQFENNYQELIDLYLIRGIRTEIITTEMINSIITGLDLQEKIRNYIIQEYQEHSIEYVLLGGDVELVPYRGFYCMVQSSSVYEDDNIPADLYYSSLDGSWNDNGNNLWGEIGEDDLLPEVSVARLVINNLNDLNNILSKIISYQDNPVLGELDKPILAGELLWEDPLTWGGDYLDLLIGYHDDNGYTTNGIPEDHDIETLYDRDIGYWEGSTLISKINEGKPFVHHVGHANWNYCMRLNLSDITNSNFSQVNGINHNYTLVYTHGCYSGAFDYDDCIGEEMINIENFAVAFAGNSRYGWFNEGQTEGPSQHLHREFIDALYGSRIGRIGNTHLESKIDTAPWVNAPGQWEEGALRWCFYDCNVIGDPAMSIWTDEPISIQATYQDSIPIGTTSLNITLSSSGDCSVEGLTCAIMKDGVLYGTGLTDSTGFVEVIFNSIITETGEAELIISGYNCLPTFFPITIIPNEGSYVILNNFEVIDDNNNIPEYDENISLNIALENIGLEDAINVYAILSTEDEFITIIDGEENVGTILGETIVTIENAFELQIANNIPDQHQINFQLEISGNSYETWYSYFDITVNAPNLLVENIIFDDSSGNNNGIIDPGETFTITIPTYNIGHATSPVAIASLTCNNDLITIENDFYELGPIEPESFSNAVFTATASDDIAQGTPITFNYEVIAEEYYVQYDFTHIVGLIIEDFETGDFSAFDWEFEGDADWTISLDAYEGVFCTQSGNIGSWQSTSLLIELNVLVDDEISFWKKVSCEDDPYSDNYDYIAFFIDGVEQDRWDGEIDWSEENYSVASGNHIFKWKYLKDGYVSSGSDCAWIDYIIFPPNNELFSVEDEPGHQIEFGLFQNYPNPFSFCTTISFNLATNYTNLHEQAQIKIYNIKGQILRTFRIPNPEPRI